MHDVLDTSLNSSNRFEQIDLAYQNYLQTHSDMAQRWLLEQTLYTGPNRRNLLNVLPVQAGHHVLDIGTGFGAMAFDLGAHLPLEIHAIDHDATTLEVARNIEQQLKIHMTLQPGTVCHFQEANVEALPFAEEQFQFVMARFVYQHLQNPHTASHEIARVLKPGGHVCLIDIDDQFVITYPEHSEGFNRLQKALIQLQSARGGDRFVGRKLATYMHEVGLQVLGTVIQPQSQFAAIGKNDVGLKFVVERFLHERSAILAQGLLSAAEFDRCLAEFIRDTGRWQLHANAVMIVIAKKSAE